MKIAAHVGIKDEVDLGGHCLDQLFAIGVDQVVVTDMGSTDGSVELLRARPDTHRVRLVESDDSEPSGLREWTSRSTRLMESRFGCRLMADAFPTIGATALVEHPR